MSGTGTSLLSFIFLANDLWVVFDPLVFKGGSYFLGFVERAIFFGVAIHDIKDGGSGAVSSRYLAVAVLITHF